MLQNSALVGNLNPDRAAVRVEDDSERNVGVRPALARVSVANGGRQG